MGSKRGRVTIDGDIHFFGWNNTLLGKIMLVLEYTFTKCSTTSKPCIRLISTMDWCVFKMHKANCQDSYTSVAGYVFPFETLSSIFLFKFCFVAYILLLSEKKNSFVGMQRKRFPDANTSTLRPRC